MPLTNGRLCIILKEISLEGRCMFTKKGFTLVEILFVLVIMAGIVAYAVPSYKRAKERSRYEAATGTLLNVGNAILSLRRDLATRYEYGVDFPSSTSFLITNTASSATSASVQVGCNQTSRDFIAAGVQAGSTNQYFVQSLYQFDYLEDFESNIASGYNFYAINGNATVCGNQCRKSDGATSDVVACMCQSSTSGTSGCFYGAKMYVDGTIERFTKSGSECN